jgi:hypothetical protein
MKTLQYPYFKFGSECNSCVIEPEQNIGLALNETTAFRCTRVQFIIFPVVTRNNVYTSNNICMSERVTQPHIRISGIKNDTSLDF